MKQKVRGTITYKAPPEIKQMKTKERLEQFFELEFDESEDGRQQFVYQCQNPEDLKWWPHAIEVEVTFWPYRYYMTNFPIKAIRTSEVRELTYDELYGLLGGIK